MKKSAKDIYMYILGAMIVIGFFALIYILTRVEVPKENIQPLNLTLGALIGSFTGVVQYFFGSSKGSADKTEIMHNGNQKPTV